MKVPQASDSTYPLSIGGHANSTYVFNGRVDEVALYKRILSADERAWLHNSGNGRAYSELTTSNTYTYDANHPHAVSALNGNSYTYDANGNQQVRSITSGPLAGTYNLYYDAENRLVQVKKNNSTIASYVYDGDGRQVQSTVNGVTTTFVGAHYQVEGGMTVKYYLAGGQRIAMRTPNNNVSYLLSDHLGSTSLTTNSTGTVTSEMRYTAWGETRFTSGTSPSNYRFTGQRQEASFGLYFYNARWYDSALGRFAQADTIVPGGVQGLDRYAYVNNNAVRYSDPSGHRCVGGSGGDDPGGEDCYENGRLINGGGRVRPILESSIVIKIGGVKPCAAQRPGIINEMTTGSNGESCMFGASGLGVVVGDRNTIYTAYHTIVNAENTGYGTPQYLWVINAYGKWVRIPWKYVTVTHQGDLAIIHLNSFGLAKGFVTPAVAANSYSAFPGNDITIVYFDEKTKRLQTMDTTVVFPNLFGKNNHLGDNPSNILEPGDSGGGVFVNGQFIGVTSAIYMTDISWFPFDYYFIQAVP